MEQPMKPPSCTEILEDMLALLQAGWCQGTYWNQERGQDSSSLQNSFCLKGAWHQATANVLYRPREINDALLKAIGTLFPDWKCTWKCTTLPPSAPCTCDKEDDWFRVVHFNDDPGRSREDVILVVKQAIADSREKEEVHGEVHSGQERAGTGSR